jgi:hypothetical protein
LVDTGACGGGVPPGMRNEFQYSQCLSEMVVGDLIEVVVEDLMEVMLGDLIEVVVEVLIKVEAEEVAMMVEERVITAIQEVTTIDTLIIIPNPYRCMLLVTSPLIHMTSCHFILITIT